jgi:putative SOS response-associated peptidase YedK
MMIRMLPFVIENRHGLDVDARFEPPSTGFSMEAENRCLVSVDGFAEYAPEPNPETKK